MRIVAGLFAICTVAACSFDESGTPAGASATTDASLIVSPPDAGVVDGKPMPPPPPDACTGKMCDGDMGPGH